MPDVSVASFWRASIALLGVCLLAVGLAAGSDASLLIAAACAACATPILVLRARIAAQHRAERRERERLANFDRQIVEIVRRHAALLERRREMIAAAVNAAQARTAFERDVARFNEKLILPKIGALRGGETPDEILNRVHLVVDEVLRKRARVAR